MTLDEILKQIKQAQNIVILTHESPDGDAIGSSLAMKLALESLGKNPDVIIPEYSRIFNFLPGTSDILKKSDVQSYDLAISLDCANFKRLVGNEHFENAKRTIVIDHHGSNNMYGDFNYVNPVSPVGVEFLRAAAPVFGVALDARFARRRDGGIAHGIQYAEQEKDDEQCGSRRDRQYGGGVRSARGIVVHECLASFRSEWFQFIVTKNFTAKTDCCQHRVAARARRARAAAEKRRGFGGSLRNLQA